MAENDSWPDEETELKLSAVDWPSEVDVTGSAPLQPKRRKLREVKKITGLFMVLAPL